MMNCLLTMIFLTVSQPLTPESTDGMPLLFGVASKSDNRPVVTWITAVYERKKGKDGREYLAGKAVRFVDAIQEQDGVTTASGTKVSLADFSQLIEKHSLPVVVSTNGKDISNWWKKLFRPDAHIVMLRSKKAEPAGAADPKDWPPQVGMAVEYTLGDGTQEMTVERHKPRLEGQRIGLAHQGYPLKQDKIDVRTVLGTRVPLDVFAAKFKGSSLPVVFPPQLPRGYEERLDSKWLSLFRDDVYIVYTKSE